MLQELMRRNDLQPILHYGGWFALVVALGCVSAALYNAGSPWCILALFVYGTCLHGTAFKTKALNRIMFFITAAIEFRATT